MSFHPTTQRLILRAPMLGDTQDVVRILNDFEVAKNLAVIPFPFTEDHFRAALVEIEQKRRAGDSRMFAVTRAMDGAFIGMCASDRMADDVWEFGYWYGRSYWRQGYATEAASAVMRHTFEDMGARALTAGWFVDNPASGRVLEKLGFVGSGTIERHCLSRGTDVTSNRMLLTREDFARKKAA
jgi:ribosomal-protein-alanine N-acetyltransferase